MLKGPFSLEEKSEQSGREFSVRSEISTFSDHIVISYPTKALLKMSEDLGIGLMLAQKVISGLTVEALKLGFLVRGGATVGRLYHRDGVVVGMH